MSVYVCIYTQVCVYTYIYVYIHIHTCTIISYDFISYNTILYYITLYDVCSSHPSRPAQGSAPHPGRSSPRRFGSLMLTCSM